MTPVFKQKGWFGHLLTPNEIDSLMSTRARNVILNSSSLNLSTLLSCDMEGLGYQVEVDTELGRNVIEYFWD